MIRLDNATILLGNYSYALDFLENASLTIFKEEQRKLTLSAINVMDSERFDRIH